MTLMFWGRGLTIAGVVGLLVGFGPAVLLSLLPPSASENFYGLLAAMLSLSVGPLSVVMAAVGILLLALGLLRRHRG